MITFKLEFIRRSIYVQLTSNVFLIEYLTLFFILIDNTYSIKLTLDVQEKTPVIVVYSITLQPT